MSDPIVWRHSDSAIVGSVIRRSDVLAAEDVFVGFVATRETRFTGLTLHKDQ